jgi:DNA repair exonuclease SbcCD ATPase subunit
MKDQSKTKKRLINELIELRQRITGLEALENERKRIEETLKKSEEAAKRLAEEKTIMAEIGRIISLSLDINEVYERFAEEVKKLISFDRVAINIVNIKEGMITDVYVTGLEVRERRMKTIIPLAGTVAEEIIRTRSGLLIQGEDPKEVVDRFPGISPSFQAGLLSMMAIPLISKDQVIGVMHLQSIKPDVYTDYDTELAKSIGAQISGAIANAQLFAERMKAEEALKEYSVRLEEMVENRTADLRKINEELKQEITERKRAEEDREKLIHELQDALASVRTMRGLLPICASCKKIRDDKGYWKQIESYIRDHSEAEFTHGICPECMKKLYPDFDDSKKQGE